MAKKMYFQLQPENFKMYDRISREGDIKFVKADAFDVEDPYYNRMIFVAKYKKNIRGNFTVKEQITGTKFKLKVIPGKENEPATVQVYSNKLELRSTGKITVEDIMLSPKKASGFYYSFRPQLTQDEKENEKLMIDAKNRKEEYVSNVINFFADAKTAARNYRNDISFQDKQIQRSLKQLSRKLR